MPALAASVDAVPGYHEQEKVHKTQEAKSGEGRARGEGRAQRHHAARSRHRMPRDLGHAGFAECEG